MVAWADTYIVLDDRGWRTSENATRWIEQNWRKLVDERFEKEVLGAD